MSYAITFDATGGLSLVHHGVKGMRWGIRRYQNEDGSLTLAGQRRYYGRAEKLQKDIDSFNRNRYQRKNDRKLDKLAYKNFTSGKQKISMIIDDYGQYKLNPNDPNYNDFLRALRYGRRRAKRIIASNLGLMVAGTIAGAYLGGR